MALGERRALYDLKQNENIVINLQIFNSILKGSAQYSSRPQSLGVPKYIFLSDSLTITERSSNFVVAVSQHVIAIITLKKVAVTVQVQYDN